MKTPLVISAFIFGASLLTAQTENKTTVRVKKIENINGKETVTDTTYTINGPFQLNTMDENGAAKSGTPDGKPKKIVIITDQVNGDPADIQVVDQKEVIDEQVAALMKRSGVCSTDVEKTVIVNIDDKNGSQKKTVKVVVVKNIRILNPSADEAKMLGQSTGISDNKLAVSDMNFYPNPSNGKFNLSFSLKDKGNTDVSVMSMEGKIIYSETLKDFTGTYDKEIDISKNPKGAYFVRVVQGTHSQLKKVVLE